ncbi:MAG: hypothetical protein JO002_11955 [Burkholderiaceae bacterium]|nr:hypothetical protein [Burkholderiaceae bacterium]
MDLNSLRIQVFEKTGIKIDTSDPVFALVALNEAVLSECVERHIATLQSVAGDVQKETAQLIEAGERTKKLLLQLGQVIRNQPGEGQPGDEPTRFDAIRYSAYDTKDSGSNGVNWRTVYTAAIASTFGALCVVLGVALAMPRTPAPVVQTPAVAPAPVADSKPAPAALTNEQLQLIQNGEKYAKMWPKLDVKTQQRIEALSK